MTVELTNKDQELLALLHTNARMPVAELARRLGVSRTTVQDRLKRLEQSGIVAGYGVRLGSDVSSAQIQAHVLLGVEPRKTHGVVTALSRLPQVQALFTVSGKFDMVAIIGAASTAKIDKVLDEIGLVDGVINTESAIILSTKLDRR